MSPAKISTVARDLVDELLVELGVQRPASVHEIAKLIFGLEGIVGHEASGRNAPVIAPAVWVIRPDVTDTDEASDLLLVTPDASPIDIAKALAAYTLHNAERRPCVDYLTPIGGRQLERDETRSFSSVGRVFTAKQWVALRDAVAAEFVLRSCSPSKREVRL